jgi:hypothetical protein
MNMAIDEAILTARVANRVPNTLRLYRWQPSAVSIGKNHEALLHDATSFEKHPSQGPSPATSPGTLELLVRERRSVRNYTEDPVPQEILRRVLEAGRYGPTNAKASPPQG